MIIIIIEQIKTMTVFSKTSFAVIFLSSLICNSYGYDNRDYINKLNEKVKMV